MRRSLRPDRLDISGEVAAANGHGLICPQAAEQAAIDGHLVRRAVRVLATKIAAVRDAVARIRSVLPEDAGTFASDWDPGWRT